MLKYYITIFTRSTNTVCYYTATEETIDSLVEEYLDTWSTHVGTTSGIANHPKEFMQAGTTRDNSKVFSILAVWTEN